MCAQQRAQGELRGRERGRSLLEAPFKLPLQFMRQVLRQIRDCCGGRGIEEDMERWMVIMKGEQGIEGQIEPARQGRCCGLTSKRGCIDLPKLLVVARREGLRDRFFIGKELIERTWRDSGLSRNMIGGGLSIAHPGEADLRSI